MVLVKILGVGDGVDSVMLVLVTLSVLVMVLVTLSVLEVIAKVAEEPQLNRLMVSYRRVVYSDVVTVLA